MKGWAEHTFLDKGVFSQSIIIEAVVVEKYRNEVAQMRASPVHPAVCSVMLGNKMGAIPSECPGATNLTAVGTFFRGARWILLTTFRTCLMILVHV